MKHLCGKPQIPLSLPRNKRIFGPAVGTMFSHCNVVEHRRLTLSGALAFPVADDTGKVKLSEGSRSSSRHAEVIAKEVTWCGGVPPETRESDTTPIHC